MDYDIQIDFQLLGTTILPKDISQRTGISPDVELIQGEHNNKLDLPRQNIWAIRSQAKSDDVIDHWDELGKILENSQDEIKEIAKTGTSKFTIIINSNQRVPSIIIPAAMSKFAGFVDAVIDIDHMQ